MKLLVINGPNLNLLGLREPAIYGSQNYESLLTLVRAACDAEGIEVGFAQSNHEGAIVDAIQAAYGVYDGIVINPAAVSYTHLDVYKRQVHNDPIHARCDGAQSLRPEQFDVLMGKIREIRKVVTA